MIRPIVHQVHELVIITFTIVVNSMPLDVVGPTIGPIFVPQGNPAHLLIIGTVSSSADALRTIRVLHREPRGAIRHQFAAMDLQVVIHRAQRAHPPHHDVSRQYLASLRERSFEALRVNGVQLHTVVNQNHIGLGSLRNAPGRSHRIGLGSQQSLHADTNAHSLQLPLKAGASVVLRQLRVPILSESYPHLEIRGVLYPQTPESITITLGNPVI